MVAGRHLLLYNGIKGSLLRARSDLLVLVKKPRDICLLANPSVAAPIISRYGPAVFPPPDLRLEMLRDCLLRSWV